MIKTYNTIQPSIDQTNCVLDKFSSKVHGLSSYYKYENIHFFFA